MEGLALTGPPNASFWRDKRVLLTGHSGFKGAWLTIWLHQLGAKVTGVSLPPATKPNLYSAAKVATLCQSHFSDIRDSSALGDLIRAAQPEIVFHLAAQPLVRVSYREPRETFETNVSGTINLLDALRGLGSVRAAVMITTDKVYRDIGSRRPFREDDPLGGHDPYSASKAACEMVIASYRDSYLAEQGVAVASARAGNVIGGGDWSEDRVIPDAVRAWQSGQVLEVRRPQAIRPWQYVLEPLSGYLTLAQSVWENMTLAGAYNFGPASSDAVTVRQLVELACLAYGEGSVCYGDDIEGPHEAGWLALDASKAKSTLGVVPKLTLVQATDRTMAWYRAWRDDADALTLCQTEITQYEATC